jgi:TRAP-type mannitol/chloroaromatic compound transport system permease small subunit
MKALARIAHWIDVLNEAVGRIVSWLMLTMVATACAVAVLRYGFNTGWVWMQESYVWMHGSIFMLGMGYTLLHDGHVRVDIFYRAASPRTQAAVNLFGTVVFLLPAIGIIAWYTVPYVLLSWARGETSREAGGLPALYLWKTTMVVFCALLILQGISMLIRSLRALLAPQIVARATKPAAAAVEGA